MKKCSNGWLYRIQLPKIHLKMKLTTFLLIVSLFKIQASSYSQGTKLTLKLDNVTIEQVFNKIESVSEFRFLFESEQLNLDRKISLDVEKKDIKYILRLFFKNTGVEYKILNRQILLSKKGEEKTKSIDDKPKKTDHEDIQYQVNGTITDEAGMPLFGANILEKGTSNGTLADLEGNFSITVANQNAVLVVSFIGFSTQEITVSGQTNINIILKEDAAALNEVVVVGYGTQAKKDVTGSIASIASEIIDQRPVAAVADALQGLAPGLNIATRAATPGQLPSITVRSIGSLSAGFEPLWVIDGFPTDQRNAQSINPADIESVEILKDASSTAIYGSRGANGVIIITTKGGRKGTTGFNVSVTSGVATVPESQRMNVLNAEEYVQFHTEINGGTVPDFIANNWDNVTDTDWQEELFTTALFQDYAISASGGSEKVSYLISGNYTDQEGTIPNEGFDKYSARLKLDYSPNYKITLGLNLAPNYSIIKTASNGDLNIGGAYQQAVLLAPILPVRRDDGSFSFGGDLPGFQNVGNPLETVELYSRTQDIFRFLGGLSLEVEPIDGLTFRATLSANIGSDNFQTTYTPPADGLPRILYSTLSELNLRKTQQTGWLNENTVNYKRAFGEHAFDILAGYTSQKEQFEALESNIADLQVQGPTILSLGDVSTLISRNEVTENTLVSYLGRLNYSFKDRYLVTGTVRNDGSSRFGANNRSQTFGSFALGWRLSEEPFMKKLAFVNNAKVRASYGSTGSNAIPDFIARPGLSPTNYSFGSTAVTGISISSPGNPNLTWETSHQLNIGLDLTLFGGRANMVLDYYNNETTSLLLSRNLVPSSGFSGFLTNIGSMRNKGVELTLNVDVVDNKDFEFSVGGNVTNNDQEILDLGGDDEIRNFFGALRRVVGGQLQNIHVTEAAGILQEGQILPENQVVAFANPQPGDVYYTDVDGDGAISNFLGPDGQILEGINVDWTYGFNTRVRYKNFELTTLFTGQAGASVLDLYHMQRSAPRGPINFNMANEYWYDGRYISADQPGDGRAPKAGRYNDGISTVSSLGIQRTDYLMFKNITLSYNFIKNLLDKIGLTNGRLFTSIENVYLWSDFVGGNPDVRTPSRGGPSLFGGSRIPGVSDGLEQGLTRGTDQPLPRIVTLGLNFSF